MRVKRCHLRDVKQIWENVIERTGNWVLINFPRGSLSWFSPFVINLWSDNNNKKSSEKSLSSVNSAFNTLRLLIPTEPKNRKLSKIETLRLAKSYISHLDAVLHVGELRRGGKFENFSNDLSSSFAVGNVLCRQPCFEVSSSSSSSSAAPRRSMENSSSSLVDYRTNICTFCVSSTIHQMRINWGFVFLFD